MSAPDTSFRIFISYRREDTAGHAGRLWDVLREGLEGEPGFEADQIFMDIDTIEPGVDFRESIRKAVDSSDVFLALIGKEWLTVTDSKGRRRLENPADFVRIEVEAALERSARDADVRVVPIRVEGAEMPGVEDLPPPLAELAHRNAIELTDERWHYDAGRLLASLKELERAKAERARPPQEDESGEEETEAARPFPWLRPARRRPVPAESDEERRHREARRRRLQKQAAAAAALVAVAAGLAALIVVLTTGGESSETRTAPRDQQTVAPPRSAELDWQAAKGSGLGGPGTQVMTSITNTRGGEPAYAAGGHERASGELDGIIWTSEDGRTWQRVAAGQAFEGDGNQKITSVTDFGGVLVAGGTDDSNGDLDIALWRSVDGATWDSVDGLALPGTDEALSRLRETAGRLFAAGSRRAEGTDGEDAAVWAFDENLEPVATVDDADFRGRGDQRISRIVVLGGEAGTQLVAVGFAAGDAGVWISQDGFAWEAVNADALGGDGDQEILDATVLDSTVVAVGTEVVDGEERGVAWLSEDARDWTRATDPDGVFEGPLPVRLNRVFDLSKKFGGDFPALVAGGSAGGKAAIWTSDDGNDWAREADSPGALGARGEINSFRPGPGFLIAVGSRQTDGDRDALALTGAVRR